MARPLPGEGFLPIEFTRMGNILGYDLYSVDPQFPINISTAESGFKVEMGDCMEVKNHRVAYSVGANPCLIVVAITREYRLYLLHTIGEYLDSLQKKTIEKATGGIAGGGREIIKKYARLLEKSNIRIIRHYDPEADFNVAVVRKKITDVPFGIHYGYGRCGK